LEGMDLTLNLSLYLSIHIDSKLKICLLFRTLPSSAVVG